MAHHFEGVIGNLRREQRKLEYSLPPARGARGTLSASVALGQGFDARSQWVKTGCLISESSYDRIEKSHRKALQRDVEVLSRERAKGDEAYSIAMLLSEYGARLWNLLKNASKFTQEGGESV